MGFKNKAKRFWDKHGETIIVAGAFIGTAATACYVVKEYVIDPIKATMDNTNDDNAFVIDSSDWAFRRQEIDEDIYVNIGEQIADLVFADDVDEGVIEKIYTVPMPKYGDFKRGTYDVLKNVRVIVRSMDGVEAEESQ